MNFAGYRLIPMRLNASFFFTPKLEATPFIAEWYRDIYMDNQITADWVGWMLNVSQN
jgi:hypothetical protein